MYLTAEVRWFYRGTTPRAVLDWLEQRSSLPEPQPPRQDHYLWLPGNESVGIKIREGRVEVKVRLQQRGTARFGENIVGQVERWRKWSFPFSSPEADPGAWLTPTRSWITVHKARRLHRYHLARDGTLSQVTLERMPGTGCDFELSEVGVGQGTWWSVCFEAFGPAAGLEDRLCAVAAIILAPGWPVAMEASRSLSYPAWIDLIRTELHSSVPRR
ncbi:MAG: hypothetical protein ACP5JJ_04285 [Anaerolineae bacterium]